MASDVRVKEVLILPKPQNDREAEIFFAIETYLSQLAKDINAIAEDIP